MSRWTCVEGRAADASATDFRDQRVVRVLKTAEASAPGPPLTASTDTPGTQRRRLVKSSVKPPQPTRRSARAGQATGAGAVGAGPLRDAGERAVGDEGGVRVDVRDEAVQRVARVGEGARRGEVLGVREAGDGDEPPRRDGVPLLLPLLLPLLPCEAIRGARRDAVGARWRGVVGTVCGETWRVVEVVLKNSHEAAVLIYIRMLG